MKCPSRLFTEHEIRIKTEAKPYSIVLIEIRALRVLFHTRWAFLKFTEVARWKFENFSNSMMKNRGLKFVDI